MSASSTDVSGTGDSSLGRSTLTSMLVMACTMISRVLGFARLAVITGVYGLGIQTDIINLTFSIPNNLRKLLAEGALSSAFIPALSKSLVDGSEGEHARGLVRKIVTFQALIIIPLCVASIVAARPLISRVLSEFDSPEEIAQATRLFRYFINYLLLISISAVLMGVLNAHSRFVIPAITPILFSIAVIVSIVIGHRSLGMYAVAVGVLAGGTFQIVFQLPLFRRLGYGFKPDFGFNDPEFRRVLAVWLPVLATSSLFTITYQVAMRFASGLGAGSVTSLSIAITFFQLPFGIFSASVTTVLFPRMSRQVAEDDTEGLRESVQYGIRFLAVLLIPSTVFLWISGRGLIAVGFQRNDFELTHTIVTAGVLTAYSAGLFAVGVFTFLQRLFYSMGRHLVPFRAAIVVAVLDVGLSLWLKETRLATAGIALANSISFFVGMIILLLQTRSRIGAFGAANVTRTGLKIAASLVPGIAAVYLIRLATGPWWESGSTPMTALLIAVEAVVFSGLVLGGYRLTRVEMLSMLLRRRSIDA